MQSNESQVRASDAPVQAPEYLARTLEMHALALR